MINLSIHIIINFNYFNQHKHNNNHFNKNKHTILMLYLIYINIMDINKGILNNMYHYFINII